MIDPAPAPSSPPAPDPARAPAPAPSRRADLAPLALALVGSAVGTLAGWAVSDAGWREEVEARRQSEAATRDRAAKELEAQRTRAERDLLEQVTPLQRQLQEKDVEIEALRGALRIAAEEKRARQAEPTAAPAPPAPATAPTTAAPSVPLPAGPGVLQGQAAEQAADEAAKRAADFDAQADALWKAILGAVSSGRPPRDAVEPWRRLHALVKAAADDPATRHDVEEWSVRFHDLGAVGLRIHAEMWTQDLEAAVRARDGAAVTTAAQAVTSLAADLRRQGGDPAQADALLSRARALEALQAVQARIAEVGQDDQGPRCRIGERTYRVGETVEGSDPAVTIAAIESGTVRLSTSEASLRVPGGR